MRLSSGARLLRSASGNVLCKVWPNAQTSPEGGICPKYHRAVELIGRRWSGAIVRVLMNRTSRFGEIHAAIPGISDRLLAERLRELEREGIVSRVHEDGPPALLPRTP